MPSREQSTDDSTRSGKPLSRRTLLASMGAVGAAVMLGATALGAEDSRGDGTSSRAQRPGDGAPPLRSLLDDTNCCCLIATISELRSMIQPDPLYFVTDPDQEGFFYYDSVDTTSPDNTGIVVVSGSGARFKRILQTEALNVKWFGAIGDGTLDDSSAIDETIQAAVSMAATDHGAAVLFPAGTYRTAANLSIPSSLSVIFGTGAVIQPDAGITVAIQGAIEAGPFPIFGGGGTVTGFWKATVVLVEWFGCVSDGYDRTAELQKLIQSLDHSFAYELVFQTNQNYEIDLSALDIAGKSLILKLNGAKIGGSLAPSAPSGLLYEQIFSGGRKIRVKRGTQPNEGATHQFDKVATHSGGNSGGAGGISRNVKVYTKIENPDDSNYEWGFLSEFDNYANHNGSQNLAAAAVSRKFGTGMTWAFYSDIVDATDNPTTTTVNSERNIHSKSLDPNYRRVVDDIVCFNNDTSKQNEVGVAIRVRMYNTNSKFRNGLEFAGGTLFEKSQVLIRADGANGILFESGHTEKNINLNGQGSFGIFFGSANGNTVGINSTVAPFTQLIRMKSGQEIAFEETGQIKMKYDSSSKCIEFWNGATRYGYIKMAPSIGGADHEL